MKQINGYWVDANNNRWNTEIYTKGQAEKCSKSLIDCYNCDNCRCCYDCHGCYRCYCCYDCHCCCDCYNCLGCYNYKQNPQRYTTGKVSSRNDQTTFYYGETKNGMEVQVACGCGWFKGNLETFEKAVLEIHKDNDLYREQYLKEIEKVKILFDLEVES